MEEEQRRRRQVELEQRRQQLKEEQRRRRRVEEQRRRQVEEEQRGIDGLGWAFLPTLDPLVSNGPFLHSSHFMSTDLLFFSFVLSIYTCIIHRLGKRLATLRRD